MKTPKKILEIGFEGGSITIFKIFDNKNDEWFFYKLSDMGSDEINGAEYEGKYSMSFPEVMFRILNKNKFALSNHPLYIDDEYKRVMIEFLKGYSKENFIDKFQWSKILNINTNDLE